MATPSRPRHDIGRAPERASSDPLDGLRETPCGQLSLQRRERFRFAEVRRLAGAPRERGLYAWWAPPGALPGVTGPVHPSVHGWELLYVGLAGNLRARLVGNHLRGPTGSSTLRLFLAAGLTGQAHFN